MNTLASIVITAEIVTLFVFCLSISFGIAFLFLRTAVILTSCTNQKEGRPAGLFSRRSLAALWLRSRHHAGR